jgi:hypothetical protein
MKRLRVGVMVSAVFAAAALLAAVSAGAESGPRCADITAETHTYRGGGTAQNEPPYSFAMELLVADPACKQIVYGVFIEQDPGSTPTAVPRTGTSETGNPQFQTTVTDDDPTICVFATAASKGGHVHDRAPDTGCLELTAPTTGAGGGFN